MTQGDLPLILNLMPSKIILRLIKEALLPAFLILGSKLLCIVIIVGLFSVSWQVESTSFIPRLVFPDADYTIFINSYSNLGVFLVVLVGLVWVLTKAYHFHDTHVSPAFVLQLLSWNLSWLLTDSHEVYHKGVTWVSYLWLVALYIGIQTVMGVNYLWVLVFVLIASIMVTWYFIADVERELTSHASHS